MADRFVILVFVLSTSWLVLITPFAIWGIHTLDSEARSLEEKINTQMIPNQNARTFAETSEYLKYLSYYEEDLNLNRKKREKIAAFFLISAAGAGCAGFLALALRWLITGSFYFEKKS